MSLYLYQGILPTDENFNSLETGNYIDWCLTVPAERWSEYLLSSWVDAGPNSLKKGAPALNFAIHSFVCHQMVQFYIANGTYMQLPEEMKRTCEDLWYYAMDDYRTKHRNAQCTPVLKLEDDIATSNGTVIAMMFLDQLMNERQIHLCSPKVRNKNSSVISKLLTTSKPFDECLELSFRIVREDLQYSFFEILLMLSFSEIPYSHVLEDFKFKNGTVDNLQDEYEKDCSKIKQIWKSYQKPDHLQRLHQIINCKKEIAEVVETDIFAPGKVSCPFRNSQF